MTGENALTEAGLRSPGRDRGGRRCFSCCSGLERRSCHRRLHQAGAGGRAEWGTLRALTFAGCPPDWSPRRAAHGFIQLLSTSPSL